MLSLLRTLGTASARMLFRRHGLVHSLATVIAKDPHLQPPSTAAQVFDEDLAFAFLTVLCLLLEDGLHQNLELFGPPVLHFLLLVVARGHAAVLRQDSTTAHITPQAKKAVVDAKAAQRAERAASLLGVPIGAAASSSAGAGGGVDAGSGGSGGGGAGVREKLQEWYKPQKAVAAVATAPAPSHSAGFDDFDDEDGGRGSSGRGGRSAGGSAAPALPDSVPTLCSRTGRLPLPRDIRGFINPADVALYLLYRATSVTDDADGTVEAAEAAAAGGGGEAATAEASDNVIATHSAAARDAIRKSCANSGLLVLCVITADCSRCVCEMVHASFPPTPAPAFLASLPDPHAAAAIAAGLPARYVQTVARLRLLLQVLEDVIFVSPDNTAVVATSSVNTAIVRPPAALSPGAAPRRDSDDDVLPQRLTVVCVLMNLVAWCVQHLQKIEATPAQLAAAAIAAGVSGSARAGQKRGRDQASPATGATQDHPLLDIMQGCLRVLINLTNDHRPGCRAVIDSWALPPPAASSPTAGTSASATSKAQVVEGADKDTTATGLHAGWGIALVMRVILAFAASSSASAGASAAMAASKRPKKADETGNATSSSSPTTYASFKQHGDHKLGSSHFDALVHACGLLANCVEHEPRARAALAAHAVPSTSLSSTESSKLMDAVRPALSAAQLSKSGMPALAFLCWLFAQRWHRLELHHHGAEAGQPDAAQTIVDVEAVTAEADKNDHSSEFEADDVVVAAYLALTLGCAMRDEPAAEAIVLAASKHLLLPPAASAFSSELAKVEQVLSAFSTVLRAFLALQTHAGVLTEEAVGHVTAVQGVFDHIKARMGGVDVPSSILTAAVRAEGSGARLAAEAVAAAPAPAPAAAAASWSWSAATSLWRGDKPEAAGPSTSGVANAVTRTVHEVPLHKTRAPAAVPAATMRAPPPPAPAATTTQSLGSSTQRDRSDSGSSSDSFSSHPSRRVESIPASPARTSRPSSSLSAAASLPSPSRVSQLSSRPGVLNAQQASPLAASRSSAGTGSPRSPSGLLGRGASLPANLPSRVQGSGLLDTDADSAPAAVPRPVARTYGAARSTSRLLSATLSVSASESSSDDGAAAAPSRIVAAMTAGAHRTSSATCAAATSSLPPTAASTRAPAYMSPARSLGSVESAGGSPSSLAGRGGGGSSPAALAERLARRAHPQDLVSRASLSWTDGARKGQQEEVDDEDSDEDVGAGGAVARSRVPVTAAPRRPSASLSAASAASAASGPHRSATSTTATTGAARYGSLSARSSAPSASLSADFDFEG